MLFEELSAFFYFLGKISQANSRYCEDKCKAFVVDVTKDPLPPEIADNSVDFVTLIFVLSAIAPEMMDIVLGKVYKVKT